MVTQDKIEEWIREVEERPASAPNILRYIAGRLSDLTRRNEELLDENLLLRTERKVEEYESRIANLEYQLDLLKRQLSGREVGRAKLAQAGEEGVSLLIYNPLGQILRLELNASRLVSGDLAAAFQDEITTGGPLHRLLAVPSKEELLFVFGSGRTAALPAAEIPAVENKSLDWDSAFYQEPPGGDELAAILPIATMSLYEFCIQTSRRGFVKKIIESFFESHVNSRYIGSGVKQKPDTTCSLAFCGNEDLLVMVSREGYLLSIETNRLPLTIEEVMRLGPADHVVAGFIVGEKPSLITLTTNGKVIHRDVTWLEPAGSLKTRGQALYSKERRAGGVRVAGAAAVDESDWGVVLWSDGRLTVHSMGEALAAGVIPGGRPGAEALGLAVFEAPHLPAQYGGSTDKGR